LKALPIILFISFFLGACAQNTSRKPRRKTTYSAETQKTFEDIEREKAIESYRKLRLENWKYYTKEKKKKRTRPVYRKKIYKKKIVKKRRPLVDPVEQENEINQNLAYYCMEHRKDARFNEENDCKLFTENIFKNCKIENNLGEPELLTCVKSRLK